MKTGKILYSYHRDINNPNRVLTIARRIITKFADESYEVEFQFAICAPYNKTSLKDVRLGELKKVLPSLSQGDVFNKAKGRELATRRLEVAPITLTGGMGVHPMICIRHYLSETDSWELDDQLKKHLYRGRDVPTFWRGFQLWADDQRSGLNPNILARKQPSEAVSIEKVLEQGHF